MKIKQSEKVDKFLDPARGLKKLWNMRVTVISIVVSALGTERSPNACEEIGQTWEGKKNWDHSDQSTVKISKY